MLDAQPRSCVIKKLTHIPEIPLTPILRVPQADGLAQSLETQDQLRNRQLARWRVFATVFTVVQ
jgi:hypothetical protein